MLGPMGDFFVVLGTVAFVLFFLGLIWALDRV
jgi:cbb3-type cytochrome oxidase subunit 3